MVYMVTFTVAHAPSVRTPLRRARTAHQKTPSGDRIGSSASFFFFSSYPTTSLSSKVSLRRSVFCASSRPDGDNQPVCLPTRLPSARAPHPPRAPSLRPELPVRLTTLPRPVSTSQSYSRWPWAVRIRSGERSLVPTRSKIFQIFFGFSKKFWRKIFSKFRTPDRRL